MADEIIDPRGFDDDPRIRKIYDIPGYTISMDLTRQRKETGLTFSKEALDDYCNAIAMFVATRVARYWNEHGEPPVKMNTLVTVGLDHKVDEHEHDIERPDFLALALALARRILSAHEAVEVATPEAKALHASACEEFHDDIEAIEQVAAGNKAGAGTMIPKTPKP